MQGVRALSEAAKGTVEVSYEGQVAVIKLRDDLRMNALTAEMGEEMLAAVDEVNASNARAVLLTGATPPPGGRGKKAFSAGGDLDFLWDRATKTSPRENQLIMMDFYRRFLCVRNLEAPVIALINGPAVGAGAALAVACDVRLGLETAGISFPFTKLGIHPGMGSSLTVPRVCSSDSWAATIMLGGTMLTGDDCVKSGMVQQLYADEESLLAAGMEMANNMASNAPIALKTMLRTLRMTKFKGLEEALEREALAQAVCYASNDFKLGLDAVKSRATPEFKDN
jgi:enoyl-CoA hydratase/carnithine racemase